VPVHEVLKRLKLDRRGYDGERGISGVRIDLSLVERGADWGLTGGASVQSLSVAGYISRWWVHPGIAPAKCRFAGSVAAGRLGLVLRRGAVLGGPTVLTARPVGEHDQRRLRCTMVPPRPLEVVRAATELRLVGRLPRDYRQVSERGGTSLRARFPPVSDPPPLAVGGYAAIDRTVCGGGASRIDRTAAASWAGEKGFCRNRLVRRSPSITPAGAGDAAVGLISSSDRST
jgi:hypothetical protein